MARRGFIYCAIGDRCNHADLATTCPQAEFAVSRWRDAGRTGGPVLGSRSTPPLVPCRCLVLCQGRTVADLLIACPQIKSR
ncbi:MAG: hypothetical protein EAZ99_17210 [Alphaproteobacteria bacterium]|nr:MAG: hypothetical protein EAZ99_17210 [Alphaproteobacteria bacterium]